MCGEDHQIFLLETGSPAHIRALRTTDRLMAVTGIVTPFVAPLSIAKLYVTHTPHAPGQSVVACSKPSCLFTLCREGGPKQCVAGTQNLGRLHWE